MKLPDLQWVMIDGRSSDEPQKSVFFCLPNRLYKNLMIITCSIVLLLTSFTGHLKNVCLLQESQFIGGKGFPPERAPF